MTNDGKNSKRDYFDGPKVYFYSQALYNTYHNTYFVTPFGASWNLVKPFLSNKGGLASNDIALIKDKEIVIDDQKLTEIFNLFNDHYINIVEKSSGTKPCNIADTAAIDDDRQIVRLILEKYKNHPNILAIIQNPDDKFHSFSFDEVQYSEVKKQLRSLDGSKSTREDQIPPKLVLLAAEGLTFP